MSSWSKCYKHNNMYQGRCAPCAKDANPATPPDPKCSCSLGMSGYCAVHKHGWAGQHIEFLQQPTPPDAKDQRIAELEAQLQRRDAAVRDLIAGRLQLDPNPASQPDPKDQRIAELYAECNRLSSALKHAQDVAHSKAEACDQLAAELAAARERALEDAAKAVEAEFANRVNSSHGATWETNGLADALAIIRALKVTP